MKREIKFRAWDNVDYMSSPFSLMDIQIGKIKFTSNVQIMQFTGLKDKNGKEIYEKDIASFRDRLYQVLINFNGYYLQKYKLWRGKFVPSQMFCMSLFTMPGGKIKDVEIVGNIYENPELISIIATLN